MKPQATLEILSAEAPATRHSVPAGPDVTLADALAEAGFPLNTRCGQRGWCRGCQVELRDGELQQSSATVSAPALVRACRVRLPAGGRAVIRLSAQARLDTDAQVGDAFVIDTPYALDPRFPLTAERDTLCAVDLGTTTVVVVLADGHTGRVLARAGAFNTQMRHGDNVLTRIVHAGGPGGLAALQHTVVHDTLAPLLARACADAARPPGRIAGLTVAGNTTMLHLLAGEDPTPLGVAPFTPRFLDARDVPAESIGLREAVPELPAGTIVHLLPGLSAYVGADLAAGLCATGMAFDTKPSLLVDLGTNGEIVLQQGGRFLACATAAGPAFEGAGLLSGTRAQQGAIERIRIEPGTFALACRLIGGGAPASALGLCGSAYVDFLAEGRRTGLLTPAGRFADEAWQALPAGRRARRHGARTLVVTDGRDGPGVEISERDLAALLQAKAAVGAGIETLLARAGVAPGQLERLYLAGGFGLHLEVAHALAIGLLPGVAAETVRVVGNTSLAGALLSGLDRAAGHELGRLRRRTEVVDLNSRPDFEDRYLDHLHLPG